MPNYDSTRYTREAAGRAQTASPGQASDVLVASTTVAVDTALATNDLIRFFFLPAGATIRSVIFRSTDLDSNGSPLITIDVGDAGDTDRLIAASTIARTGGTDATLAAAGWDYQYTSETLIYATVTAQGATRVAGTVSLTVLFTIEGLAS